MTASPHPDAVPPAASGWPDGEHLVRTILRGSDRVVAGVTGPGGSGKSTLLERMAAELRAGGARVIQGVDAGSAFDAGAAETPVVVFVDDAEQLPTAQLPVLDRVVGDEFAHLVVAFRPSPSAAVTEVLDRAGRGHSTVTLHPLSTTEVAARSAALLGTAAAPGVIARVVELTAGNPRLVDLAFVAVCDEGWDLDVETEIPSQVLDAVADELDGLERLTRQFILALAVGFSASGPALATASRFASADTLALMQAARASGLASADGRLSPMVRAAVLRTALPDEAWSLRCELVDAIEAAGMPLDDAALSLAAQGHRDRRVAEALERAGDELLAIDPVEAGRRYAAAVDAGADRAALEARRAHAAWAGGDVREAERLVDRLLGRGESPDVCRAIEVAAAVWARQGLLRRSAEAYERVADERCSLVPLAVACLATTGELERATALRDAGDRVAYPTSSHMAIDLMADGLLQLLDDDADRALASLLNASSVMSEAGTTIALPEVPAVLAAQVALAVGELRIADEVLSSAIERTQGGPAFAARLQLMRGLVALRSDRPLHAREHLAAAMADATTRPLGLRDELLAGALRVGLARHQGEIPVLVRAWEAARQSIAGMRPDLTTLPALAELVVAAARVGEMHLVEGHLRESWALLEGAGAPSPLKTALHWAEIESALLRNDSAAVEHHAGMLDGRDGDRTARRLARAGRTWASALAGDVDVEAVERAARELVASGYPWDAARLAGHAAGRAAEHRDSLRLLALARSLHPDEGRSTSGPRAATRAAPASTAPTGPGENGGALSSREREVARLVLEGKTYAEIGEAIFISPRTAEHHIARIRRRLGATNRSDLISKLRAALEVDEAR